MEDANAPDRDYLVPVHLRRPPRVLRRESETVVAARSRDTYRPSAAKPNGEGRVTASAVYGRGQLSRVQANIAVPNGNDVGGKATFRAPMIVGAQRCSGRGRLRDALRQIHALDQHQLQRFASRASRRHCLRALCPLREWSPGGSTSSRRKTKGEMNE